MAGMLTDAHQTLWTGSRQSLPFTAAALPLGALRDKKRPRRPMKLSAQAAGALSRYLFCTASSRPLVMYCIFNNGPHLSAPAGQRR